MAGNSIEAKHNECNIAMITKAITHVKAKKLDIENLFHFLWSDIKL